MRHSFTIILILASLLLLNQAILSQINPIPNHSFENWVDDEPVDWTTSNADLPGSITQSGDAVDGNSSVKLSKSTEDTLECTAGGSVSRVTTKFPVDIKYSAIKFDIKIVEKSISDCWGVAYYIILYNSGDIIGSGGGKTLPVAMDWTEVVLNINYFQAGIPDTAFIGLEFVDSAASMNYMLVDDIELLYFSITNPVGGDNWKAGTEDTIKWVGGLDGGLAQLEFSADSGNTFELIDNFIPADTGLYVWAIPDSIQSNNCYIRIFDMAYNFILDTSDLFEIGGLSITNPVGGVKWIAGLEDTIKWVGGEEGDLIQLEFSADSGNTFDLIDFSIPADTGQYVWAIPDTILSTKCYIRIFDMTDSTITDTSDRFKIKGYRLTKLDANGDYIAYDIFTDRWGFGNSRSDVWPIWWWSQFDYQSIDPFTESQYSQWQGNFVFASTISEELPDWEAWVNAFTENACYISTILGIYSPTALTHWDAKKHVWEGSCFGIAASNALAFSHKAEFDTEFIFFPSFTDPITVTSDSNVIPVMSELFSHQFGNPTHQFRIDTEHITPNETLNEAKEMLLKDDVPIRTLSFWNNNGTGGHTILPYELEQDTAQAELYYLYVYDNSFPNNTTALVLIDTTGNSNQGTWLTQYAWTNWGGSKDLILEKESSVYLNDPILPKNSGDFVSPFILSGDDLQVYNNIDVNTRIYDSQGNLTGFVNGTVYNEIANSVPLIYLNANETPPYGYYLPTDNYSIQVSDFTSDTVETFFFTGNKTYLYKRTGTITTQTDRLFFDGGVSAVNPDQVDKSISLINIINESTEEKLFALRQIALAQNDSVKIENPDNNNLKFISYGTEKNYQIELNYATQLGLGRFANNSIAITQNTTHLLVPNWGDFSDLQLTIYVDEGNDGTINDTLYIINNVTDVGDDQGSLIPTEYRLEQNYPNPFNPTTTIKYSIPQQGFVTIKIYNAIGEEVVTLINEEQPVGNYEVEFNASALASGIYFYRLQAGDFVETKKMSLLR